MARGIWHYLRDMPPVDVDAVAHWQMERRAHLRPGSQPAEWGRKAQEARDANRRARQRQATDRCIREMKAKRAQRRDVNVTARILVTMEPGQWYGRPDIEVLAGAKRNSVHMLVPRLEQQGLIEQAENPDWKPVEYRKGVPVHIAARGRPPRYLFRLTQAGEVERARWVSAWQEMQNAGAAEARRFWGRSKVRRKV